MTIAMTILGVGFLVAAAISFFWYERKSFDTLLLCGVIFLSAAAPSYEADASIDELKAITHHLDDLKKSIESLPRR